MKSTYSLVSVNGTVGRIVTLMLIASALLGLAGCATSSDSPEAKSPVPEDLYSGFLGDYSRLEPVAGEAGTLLWVNPDTDFPRYDRVIIAPVVLKLSPDLADQGRPDPDNAAKISQYFDEAFARELAKTLTITDEPGDGVVRIEPAISGAQVTRQDLSAVNLIPVGLVITGVGEATGSRDKVSYVFMEGRATDTLTGEILAETVQAGVGKVSGDVTTRSLSADQVKAILDHWASKLAERATMLRSKGS